MLIIAKSGEKNSNREGTVREPWQVRVGTEDTGEHGLGAALSIGRQRRVRPLLRFEAPLGANQGGTAVNFIALAMRRGDFLFGGKL